MSIQKGTQVSRSPNVSSRSPLIIIGVVAVRVLESNADREVFRVYASGLNIDNIFLGPDSGVVVANTLDIIGPGEMFEDSGYIECYKGPVWLISAWANQQVIVEEVSRARRVFRGE